MNISTQPTPSTFTSITHAFHNNIPLSLESNLLPFGSEPLRFDTFAISSPEAFSKKGATVTLDITLLSCSPLTGSNPALAWEYFDGKSWQSLVLADTSSATTRHFTPPTGMVKFTIPDDSASGEVAGIQGYWIRARLVGGDYGKPSFDKTTTTDPNDSSITTETFTTNTSNIKYPIISGIKVTLEPTTTAAPEVVLMQNNLDFQNNTLANQADNASARLFQNAADLNGYPNTANPPETAKRNLYFGFDQPFDIRPLSLFVDAEEQAGSLELVFEVLANDDWRKVTALDATNGFHQRGFVQVFVDFKPRLARLFGREAFWLRVHPRQANNQIWSPRLYGIYPNAAPATQAKTLPNELLGASAGEPGLQVQLASHPVLPDSLELRIREHLSDEERNALLADSDDMPDPALPVRTFTDASLAGDWVLWQAVDSFIGVSPDARVFQLDPATGIIRFGNNRQGRIPPAGSNHIRAIRYQTGGGIRGNTAAHTITRLKSAVEGVESVTNPIQAAGGTDAPSLEAQLAQAPASLSRANCVVTAADMEALAISTSPDLIRARCLPPTAADAPIQLAILIRNGTRCPQPTLAEQAALARLILTQAWGGLQPEDIKVVAPHYVKVKLELVISPDDPSHAAQLEQAAIARIRLLLHPSEGGPDSTGWPFGRPVWESDILRALADLPGFDSVETLQLTPKEEGMDFSLMPPLGVICALEEDLRITVAPREDN